MTRMRIIKIGIPQEAYDLLEEMTHMNIRLNEETELRVEYDKVSALARECLMVGLREILKTRQDLKKLKEAESLRNDSEESLPVSMRGEKSELKGVDGKG